MLHPERANIERKLAAQEKTMFDLDESVCPYELASTYLEGRCPLKAKAKRTC